MSFENFSSIYSQNYSQEISLSTQQENEEETSNQKTQDMANHNLSTTIESICEENHQLGGMVTASLESLDKYREKLREDLTKINLQLKENEEIHNEQKKKLINLQMEHENFDSQYQQEVEQRKELLNKLNVTHEVASLLSHHHNVMSNSLQNFQEDHKTIKNTMSEGLNYLNQLQAKSNKDNNEFQTQKDTLVTKISILEDENTKYRQEMTKKIVDKKTKLLELSERELQLEQQVNVEIQKRNQLSEDYKNISLKHNTAKNNISDLKQNLKEVQKKKSEEIPKLNVMINTARNELSNITNTHESNEKYLNDLNMKTKQAVAKIKELESSIVESRQQEVNHQEQILSLSGKINKLKIREVQLQNNLKHRKNIESEIIRFKKILEGKKIDKDKITSTVDQNRKINMKVNDKLIILEKEVEDNTSINNNLKKDNDTLQTKIEQIEFGMDEVKQAWKIKQQAIDETINDQKGIVIQKTHENDNLTTTYENSKEEYTKLCNEKEIVDGIYKTNNVKLKSIKLKSTELQKTLKENFKLYTLTKQDEEDKLNDLENQLVDNLEELQDLRYLRDNKTQIEDTIKERDNIWIAQNNEEIHKFSLQIQDLNKERALYQANIDAISQQEKKNLSKAQTLITNRKQLAVQLECKLKHSKEELSTIYKTEAEYQNKIARLDEKLQQVTDTAKVTKQEIKTALATNKDDVKVYTRKPKSTISKKQQPTKRTSTTEGTSFKKQLKTDLMTPSSSSSVKFSADSNLETKKTVASAHVSKKDSFEELFNF